MHHQAVEPEADITVALIFHEKLKGIRERVHELDEFAGPGDGLANEVEELEELISSLLRREILTWCLRHEVRETAQEYEIRRLARDLDAERTRAEQCQQLAAQHEKAAYNSHTASQELWRALQARDNELRLVKTQQAHENAKALQEQLYLEEQVELIDCEAAATEAEQTEERLRAQRHALELHRQISSVSAEYSTLQARHNQLMVQGKYHAELDQEASLLLHEPGDTSAGGKTDVYSSSSEGSYLGKLLHTEMARVSRLLQVNASQRSQIGSLLGENERLRLVVRGGAEDNVDSVSVPGSPGGSCTSGEEEQVECPVSARLSEPTLSPLAPPTPPAPCSPE